MSEANGYERKAVFLEDMNEGQALWLFCPACMDMHRIFVGANMITDWQWNEDFHKPTLSPSINLANESGRCHSFVKDGMWQYLPDSTHALAGFKTPVVPVPLWFIRKMHVNEEPKIGRPQKS